MEQGKTYGWKSDLFIAEGRQTAIWRTIDGADVEIHSVSSSDKREYAGYDNYPDLRCVGEVVEFVRRGQTLDDYVEAA